MRPSGGRPSRHDLDDDRLGLDDDVDDDHGRTEDDVDDERLVEAHGVESVTSGVTRTFPATIVRIPPTSLVT